PSVALTLANALREAECIHQCAAGKLPVFVPHGNGSEKRERRKGRDLRSERIERAKKEAPNWPGHCAREERKLQVVGTSARRKTSPAQVCPADVRARQRGWATRFGPCRRLRRARCL